MCGMNLWSFVQIFKKTSVGRFCGKLRFGFKRRYAIIFKLTKLPCYVLVNSSKQVSNLLSRMQVGELNRTLSYVQLSSLEFAVLSVFSTSRIQFDNGSVQTFVN
jgi:hypothetical protein